MSRVFCPTPIPATISGCSLWIKSVMFVFAKREHPRLISHEIRLFSKYSNLCDHDTSTSRTDRRLAAVAIPRSASLRVIAR